MCHQIQLDPRCTNCGAPLDYLPAAWAYPHLCKACEGAMAKGLIHSSGIAVQMQLADSYQARVSEYMRCTGALVKSARHLVTVSKQLMDHGVPDTYFQEAVRAVDRALARLQEPLLEGRDLR